MLTTEHKREFHRNGFLILHDAIDADVISRARDIVWGSIPETPDKPEEWSHDNQSLYSDDLKDQAPFRELNDIASAYVAEFLGEDNMTYAGDANLQVALRFPDEQTIYDPTAPQISDVHSHVDGTLDISDGQGDLVPHTINTAIYLDRVQPYGGGFTAWPGSHLDVCRFLEEHPLPEVKGGIPAPDGEGGWQEGVSRDEVFDPVEVIGGPGTITIWHGRLEHEGGINLSPGTVRMAAIKRFFHEKAWEFQEEAPGDPYRGWDGMDDIRPTPTP